jgi:hypothetical protein
MGAFLLRKRGCKIRRTRFSQRELLDRSFFVKKINKKRKQKEFASQIGKL